MKLLLMSLLEKIDRGDCFHRHLRHSSSSAVSRLIIFHRLQYVIGCLFVYCLDLVLFCLVQLSNESDQKLFMEYTACFRRKQQQNRQQVSKGINAELFDSIKMLVARQ